MHPSTSTTDLNRSALLGHVLSVCRQASAAIAPIAPESADSHADQLRDAFGELRGAINIAHARAVELLRTAPGAPDVSAVIRALNTALIAALDAQDEALEAIGDAQ